MEISIYILALALSMCITLDKKLLYHYKPHVYNLDSNTNIMVIRKQ